MPYKILHLPTGLYLTKRRYNLSQPGLYGEVKRYLVMEGFEVVPLLGEKHAASALIYFTSFATTAMDQETLLRFGAQCLWPIDFPVWKWNNPNKAKRFLNYWVRFNVFNRMGDLGRIFRTDPTLYGLYNYEIVLDKS